MSFIYLLCLENDKYYVGRTSDIHRRIGQHFLGEGAKWTKLHKPKSIILYTTELNEYHEDYMTLLTMKKYGIDNVRGGRWCMQFFSDSKKAQLNSYISYIDEKLSVQENMTRIENIRLDYIITVLSLHGIDKDKFGKDELLWQELIEIKKCTKCRQYHEIKFDKPYCYECWKKEFILTTGKQPIKHNK